MNTGKISIGREDWDLSLSRKTYYTSSIAERELREGYFSVSVSDHGDGYAVVDLPIDMVPELMHDLTKLLEIEGVEKTWVLDPNDIKELIEKETESLIADLEAAEEWKKTYFDKAKQLEEEHKRRVQEIRKLEARIEGMDDVEELEDRLSNAVDTIKDLRKDRSELISLNITLKSKLKDYEDTIKGYQDQQGKSLWKCGECGLMHEDAEVVIQHLMSAHGYPREDAELHTQNNQ